MENQHRKITGYRELNQEEINSVNAIKELGIVIDKQLTTIENSANVDPRWFAIGKTDLQKGLMSIVRSITKPEFF